MTTTESRSSNSMENLQEALDTGHTGDASMEQYVTPPGLAAELMGKLPVRHPATILDPQVCSGALVNCAQGWPQKFGIELDQDKQPGGVQTITGNCIKVFEAIEELMPDLRFVVANANPPFGRRWKMKNGQLIDSTLATWRFVTAHANCGFFIANANTIEKLELHLSTDKVEVTFYERRQALQYWKGMRPELEIGVLCWKAKPAAIESIVPIQFEFMPFTPPGVASAFWNTLRKIIDEEKIARPPFNIYLSPQGFLKTYLSQRNTVKLKLTKEQIAKLHKLADTHPLTLTTEKETRVLMRHLIDCGIYTIQPEAKDAIENALFAVNALACPIMPVNDFETVAYTEEEDHLVCNRSTNAINGTLISLTAGKSYPLNTGSYTFTEAYVRNKVHFNEETKVTYTKKHDCTLTGSDRYITIKDDSGVEVKFMDRPNKANAYELPETMLWEYFHKPKVNTVAENCKEAVAQNHAVLKACEMMAGYQYYEGQLGYMSRLAVKDAAVVAAETGVGKSLLAISLLAMKSPNRALIIAPQGAMRASKVAEDDEASDEENESMSASQWMKELTKFAPYLQVWEIFSHEDYLRILALNNGQLPPGVYVTYYEAFFSNGAREKAPASWDDKRLNQHAKMLGLAELPPQQDGLGAHDKMFWCDSIGKEKEGIRCILAPCLSTLIGDLFDCVIVDEAHRCKGLSAVVTQMLIRLQPRYRYCLTATPVSNDVLDLFPIMGWLAVADWYKGDRRNAAWPYAREDLGRFGATFKTQERDHTQEAANRKADPKNRTPCIKASPIISSPARLLKLIKPNLAFISKAECRADYLPPKVIDVRVPMGRQQAMLYGHYTNRANVPAPNAYVRAGKQVSWLRSICADPAGFQHGGKGAPKCSSNMNPKVIAMLELTRDILGRGEQVVIINSRIGLTSTVAAKLMEAGVPIARIDSTQDAEQHAYQANLFKSGKARVLLMGIKCAAAYSFDQCENLIIGSLEYAWGVFNQACGRIDRITNACIKNIYVILHQNSIEEVQFEVVSIKGDAANLCLRGKRVPRDFKPVDANEILADALDRFDLSASTPEPECEKKWPKLRAAIQNSLTNVKQGLASHLN